MANNEVLIAQAWGHIHKDGLLCEQSFPDPLVNDVPVLIVHGIPESELRELLELRRALSETHGSHTLAQLDAALAAKEGKE